MNVQSVMQQLLRNQDPNNGSCMWSLARNTFLVSAVYKAASYLFSIENIVRFFNYCLHFVGHGYNTITIYGKPTKKNPKSEIEKEDFSVRFKALLHQLRKAGLSKAGVHYLVDGANPESENEPFIVSQPTTFSLAPNVYCTIRKQKAEKQWSWDEDKEGKNFRADVFSRDKSIEELEKLIMHWIKEYNQYILETGENAITLIGLKRKGFTEGFDFSNKFLAVIHKLKTLNLELPSIKQLTEIQLKEAPQYRYSRNDEEEKRYIRKPYILQFVKLRMDSCVGSNGRQTKTNSWNILFKSSQTPFLLWSSRNRLTSGRQNTMITTK